MDAQFVLRCLFPGCAFSAKEVADTAVDPWNLAVGVRGNAGMATGAIEASVNRLFQRSTINILFRGFLPVAEVTVLFGIYTA